MSDLSSFESRSGKLSCSPEKAFAFVTDMRNFEQFVPSGTVGNWQAGKESCNFSVPRIGSVSLKVTQKREFDLVTYEGDALGKNEFELILNISSDTSSLANVKISVRASLNPVMKMVVSNPLNSFLEMIIDRMEKFRAWEKVKE